MEPNEISAVAGVVLSLFFSYVPGLNAKFAALAPEWKRLIMLGLLAVVAGAVYGLSCTGVWRWVECDTEGAKLLIKAFIVAVVTNQGIFTISPQPKAVKAAKATRA